MKLRVFQQKLPVMLGIDISPASIKLLELRREGKRYGVECYARQKLPPGVIQDREIKDIHTAGMVLRELIKQSGTQLKYAAVAVAGNDVITKILSMRVTEQALEKQIILEAQRYLPIPINEVNIDFQILGPSTQDPNSMDVLLVATRSEKMNGLIEALSIAKLTPKVVDIEKYALVRSLCLMSSKFLPGKEKLIVAILDIGATKMALHVLHNAIPVYTREENFGVKQLTDEISQYYGLTWEDALLAIREKKEKEIVDKVDTFREMMVKQIIQMLFEFSTSGYFSEIHHLVLAGGGASLPKLVYYLQEKLGIPTIIAEPFMDMTLSTKVNPITLKTDAPSLMICCGLAMRSYL